MNFPSWISDFRLPLFLIIGMLAGCGDDQAIVSPDVDDLTSEGWAEYGAGNYEDAIGEFEKVLEYDTDNSEAYNGIGWSRARLGQTVDSIESFKNAVTKDPDNADAYAGLAGAYLADGDYERAIASAKMLLSRRPEYKSHHDDIKAADIRILLAECYHRSGDYAAARAQIDLLGGSGKTLDPSSATYPADLLAVIQELARKSL